MRYFLIAGEPSGDLHASHLITALKSADPEAEFRGWGGDLMEAAGATILTHYRELAFMGIIRVVINLRTILKNEQQCREDIAAFHPDRLILIDYSGFNLRIASWAKPQGYDISYYISPQVWAWRSGRVKKIKKFVDRMLVILPFEKAWYAERGVEVTFVGHPLLDVVERAGPQVQSSSRIIAVLPGSRKQEISTGLPIMLAAAARLPDYEYVIAEAPSQEPDFYAELIGSAPPNVRTVRGDTYGLLATAHAAMVTSGTATLETALFGVPQVVCYRGNPLEYFFVKRFIGNRIKFISLVNLVMDRAIVTELIQDDFNAARLAGELQKTIAGPDRDRQLNDLDQLRGRLGSGGAADRAARAIVKG